MKWIMIILLILMLIITGCGKKTPLEPQNPEDNLPPPETIPIPEPEPVDPIQQLLDEMTLEEKIGQLLIVGIEGEEMGEMDIENIHENKVGGFILFGRNISNQDQLLNLINSLKHESSSEKVPLFISVDEEGGRVSRLSGIFTAQNKPKALGRINNPELSYKYGEILGMKLNQFGFNMNFSPVLDIDSNPKNPVIGDRAYGNSPDLVKEHGVELMNGIKRENIIPVGKHFPGHGDTDVDSHLELPLVNKNYEELQALELIPFKAAIDEGIDMIMVAHILYPQLDNVPSSMSKKLIQHTLRDDFHFQGVVISDDMTMGAILDNYSIEEASLEFLKASGDIVLVSHGVENPSIVINRIKLAIQRDELSMEEIDQKVYRILKLKEKYNINWNKKESVQIDEINALIKDLNNKLK